MKWNVQSFPDRMDLLPVCRENMRLCQVSGLFREETALINGHTRPFLTYLAEGLESDRNVLIVAPPSGYDPAAFAEESGLLQLADRMKFFLHLLMPDPDGWDLLGDAADYFHGVFDASVSRRHYVTMVKQDNFYALGFGDGADVALQAATRRPVPRRTVAGRELPPLSPDSDLFSGLGLVGDVSMQGLCFARQDQPPTPVWLWSNGDTCADSACSIGAG